MGRAEKKRGRVLTGFGLTLAVYGFFGLSLSVMVAWTIAALQVRYLTDPFDWGSYQTTAGTTVNTDLRTFWGFGSARRSVRLEREGGPSVDVGLGFLQTTTDPHRGNLFLAWAPIVRTEWGATAWSRRMSERFPEFSFIEASDDAQGFPALCLFTYQFRSVDLDGAYGMADDEGYPPLAAGADPQSRGRFGGIPVFKRAAPGALSNGRSFDRSLPLLPIWEGLAINTVFYGLLAFGARRGVPGIRRLRRYRRGLCPRCAYDLRGDYSRGCPECGSQLFSTC